MREITVGGFMRILGSAGFKAFEGKHPPKPNATKLTRVNRYLMQGLPMAHMVKIKK
jgi:hypothetical protein